MFIFNGAGECVSFEMDDDVKDGMWVVIPCADHQVRKKKCDCPDKKRVFKPFVRNVCDRCFKRKKKCTHEKPAFKTKRVQEEQPTSYEDPKEPATGAKGAVDEEPFPFEEELDLNFWDDKEEYDAFKAGLRGLLDTNELR